MFRREVGPGRRGAGIEHHCGDIGQRMFRRSGYRFADKNMRRSMKLEPVPIPQERDRL
jgi:hypothetical protein